MHPEDPTWLVSLGGNPGRGPTLTNRHVHDQVRRLRERLEARERRTSLTVVLLGAEGAGLQERRDIAKVLEAGGMNVLIPEDDLPHDVSPSLAEEEMLAHGDIDLVFLDVDSWGTATEFGQLYGRELLAWKLRVLVRAEYHPLYGSRRSYLSDLYLNHLAVYGHVYAVGVPGEVPASTVSQLVPLLARRFRSVRAAKPELTK